MSKTGVSFCVGGPEYDVAFNKLPAQIQKHYQGVPPSGAHISLRETHDTKFDLPPQALLMYAPEPMPERSLGWVDCWEKNPDGDWVLVTSGHTW
jgi:hypothetical protein